MKTLLARWSRFPRVSAKTRGDTAPFFMLVVFNFLYPQPFTSRLLTRLEKTTLHFGQLYCRCEALSVEASGFHRQTSLSEVREG